MRILCLTPRLPYPPHRGDRLRAFNIIKHLAAEHELSLVSFIAQRSERAYLPRLRSLCKDVRVILKRPLNSAATVAGNLWRPDSMQALYFRSDAMRRLVAEMLAKHSFDAAYVHLFRMAPYLADYPQLYRILDMTDVISAGIGYSLPYRPLLSRLIYRIEKPRIARYERWTTEKFNETWLISAAERRHLVAACPQANIQVVPNGVDTDCFHPTGQPCDDRSIVYVGMLKVFHNIDAATHLARDILPLVRRQIPDCRLRIVGSDLGARIKRLANAPGVTAVGFEPDLNGCLNRSAALVAPLRAVGGVQNKVLEAMAAARPVVTSSLVNKGLGAKPERDLLIADSAAATARQVVRLLYDEKLRTGLGRAARQFVRQRFSWNAAAERMRAVQVKLTAAGRIKITST